MEKVRRILFALFTRTLSNCRIAQKESVKGYLVSASNFYVLIHNKRLSRLINLIFDSITRAINSLKDDMVLKEKKNKKIINC